jgi:hypothetical protein
VAQIAGLLLTAVAILVPMMWTSICWFNWPKPALRLQSSESEGA